MSCFVSGHKMQTRSAATTTAARAHVFPCFDNSTEMIIQKRDVSHVTALQVFTQTVRLTWVNLLSPVQTKLHSKPSKDGDLTWWQGSRGCCLLSVFWLLVSAPSIFILLLTCWLAGFDRILLFLFIRTPAGETTGDRWRLARKEFWCFLDVCIWCSSSLADYMFGLRCVPCLLEVCDVLLQSADLGFLLIQDQDEPRVQLSLQGFFITRVTFQPKS